MFARHFHRLRNTSYQFDHANLGCHQEISGRIIRPSKEQNSGDLRRNLVKEQERCHKPPRLRQHRSWIQLFDLLSTATQFAIIQLWLSYEHFPRRSVWTDSSVGGHFYEFTAVSECFRGEDRVGFRG